MLANGEPVRAAVPLLGSLVEIVDHGDPMRSEITVLVAALLTLGIPRASDDYFECTCEFQRGEWVWRSTWNLRDGSKDNRFDARRMERAWHDQAWLAQNPQHPLAILRSGLTLQRAVNHTPRFTGAELTQLETPDTWLEAGYRNLIGLLRDLPRMAEYSRKIIRFGRIHSAGVPRIMADRDQTRFLKYVEHPSKRAQFA